MQPTTVTVRCDKCGIPLFTNTQYGLKQNVKESYRSYGIWKDGFYCYECYETVRREETEHDS